MKGRRGVPVVRITDHRQPGAGAKPPLERRGATRGGSVAGMSGLDHLTESRKREAEEHDRFVEGYSVAMLPAVFDDVCRRIESFPTSYLSKQAAAELRWWKSRKAALLRRGSSLRERGLA